MLVVCLYLGAVCQYKINPTTSDVTIFVADNSSCSVQNASITSTQNSITVTGLLPGNTYYFKINCSAVCCANFSTSKSLPLLITALNIKATVARKDEHNISAFFTLNHIHHIILSYIFSFFQSLTFSIFLYLHSRLFQQSDNHAAQLHLSVSELDGTVSTDQSVFYAP